jgi:DNA-binding ferritin-like protein (Dps family)
MTDNHKTLIEMLGEVELAVVVKGLLSSSDKEYRHKFELHLQSIHDVYLQTPDGFAKDILMGTYKLMIDKYEHSFGEKFRCEIHKRITRAIADRQEITKFHRERIYGEGKC